MPLWSCHYGEWQWLLMLGSGSHASWRIQRRAKTSCLAGGLLAYNVKFPLLCFSLEFSLELLYGC